jgi:hypothetical protein
MSRCRPLCVGERYSHVVRDLLMRAQQYVTISTVYADGAFAAADVVRALEQHHVKYVIPKPKDARVKRFIRRIDNDDAVKYDHTIHGKVLGGPTNAPAETILGTVPSNHDEDKTVAFRTRRFTT